MDVKKLIKLLVLAEMLREAQQRNSQNQEKEQEEKENEDGILAE